MNGIRIRFETKPGKSLACAGTLPRSSASFVIAAAVSSDVCAAADHLHELQHRHRVEEVHPDHAFGPLGDAAERCDRDRRGVRGEHRLVGKDPVCAAEEVLLHRRVLDDRLDHQVGGHELVDGAPARAPHPGRRRPSRRASRGSAHRAEPAFGGAGHGVVAARHGGRTLPRPARCRLPSGPRRRRERARSPSRERLTSAAW